MPLTVVVGVNWGDEGKGRIVDYLAQDTDFVIRYQGGNNAGHTVVNDLGTFKLHLIPSGIFNPAVMNILGPGMVVDLAALDDEITQLRASGIQVDNIRLSDRAAICFPYHQMEDVWEEERLGHKAYGSTKRGIAPAYGDRYRKKSIQVGEIFYPELLKPKLRDIVEWKNSALSGMTGKAESVSFEETWDWVVKFGDRLKPIICDTSELMAEALEQDKNFLFEAQLGALRDVYHGTYPFTSSSCSLAGFATIGGGVFGRFPDRVIGVMKAFSTSVGTGPMVTEMTDAEQVHELRETANEYGAATGRPRRIGHFDALASKYGAEVQSATDIALTKLDSLTGQKSLKVCTHYEYNGKKITKFPLNPVLDHCQPVYEDMPGWNEDITGVRQFDLLPENARNYVLRLEELMGKPITYVSIGPERDQLIIRSRA